MKRIFLSLILTSFFSMGTLLAQTAAGNNGFYTVRYAKDTVRIGQEFRVFYAAESELKNFTSPEFESTKLKVGAERLPQSLKDRPFVDGKRMELDLKGYSFFVTPVDTGWCVIPSASAKLGKKTIQSPTLPVYVLPMYEQLSDCEVKVVPAKPKAGTKFELVVSSKFRFDVHPVLDFDQFQTIADRPKVGMTMDQSGSKYTYTYVLVADSPGSYTIPAFDVNISRKAYTVQPFTFEIKESASK